MTMTSVCFSLKGLVDAHEAYHVGRRIGTWGGAFGGIV